ncbi:MAG: serine hydrolase domain-containing protein [Bacteroidota bacterium]
MKKIQTWVAFIFILSTFSLYAQEPKVFSPESVKMSSDSLSKMENYLHGLVDENRLAGIQTAIIKNNQLIYFNSYGYSDIANKQRLDEKSIFRIFSMTKPIVSVALMQQYEQGKFKLNDSLSKYIPEFRESFIYGDSVNTISKNPIKIVDLLTHTSGINYGRGMDEGLNAYYQKADLWNSKDNKEFADKLSKVPLQFEPGTDWAYGMSTNLVGHLVEIFSGMNLRDYLNKFIFQPLEMKSTFLHLPKDRIDDFTVGYRWNSEEEQLMEFERPQQSRFLRETELYNGGGGLLSTTMDYSNFCRMLLNGGKFKNYRIIKKETLDLMFKDHLVEVRKYQERLRLPIGEAGFGLGFAIKGESSNKLENVFGWGGAVGTYFRVDTDNDLAYILMIQLSPYRHLRLRERFQEFVNSAIISDE